MAGERAHLNGDDARLLQVAQRVLYEVRQVVRQVPVAGTLWAQQAHNMISDSDNKTASPCARGGAKPFHALLMH